MRASAVRALYFQALPSRFSSTTRSRVGSPCDDQVGLDQHLDVALGRAAAQVVDDEAGELRQVHRLALQRLRRQLRQREQRVDHVVHARRGAEHAVEMVDADAVEHAAVVFLDDAREALDDADRRAQVVRDGVGEGLLVAETPFGLGRNRLARRRGGRFVVGRRAAATASHRRRAPCPDSRRSGPRHRAAVRRAAASAPASLRRRPAAHARPASRATPPAPACARAGRLVALVGELVALPQRLAGGRGRPGARPARRAAGRAASGGASRRSAIARRRAGRPAPAARRAPGAAPAPGGCWRSRRRAAAPAPPPAPPWRRRAGRTGRTADPRRCARARCRARSTTSRPATARSAGPARPRPAPSARIAGRPHRSHDSCARL